MIIGLLVLVLALVGILGGQFVSDRFVSPDITASSTAISIIQPVGGEIWVVDETKDIVWRWPNAKNSAEVSLFAKWVYPPCPEGLSCDPLEPDRFLIARGIAAEAEVYHWRVALQDQDQQFMPAGEYSLWVCAGPDASLFCARSQTISIKENK